MKVEYSNQFIRLTTHFKDCICWMGYSDFEDAMVCIKSSFMSNEDLIDVIENLELHQLPYISSSLCLYKVKVHEKSLIYDKEIICEPYDIHIYPLRQDVVLINNQVDFTKTVPVQVGYFHTQKKEGFFKSIIHHHFQLCIRKNINLSLNKPIAYYRVNHFAYPLTKEMLNHPLDLYTQSKDSFDVYINQEFKKYFILKEE